MISDRQIDKDFLNACRALDVGQAQKLVDSGADPLACGFNGSGLHTAIPEIASRWPDTRQVFESMLKMGMSLNHNPTKQDGGAYGTPLHRLAWSITDTNMQKKYDNISAFVAEAINRYGADLSLTETRQEEFKIAVTVPEAFMQQGHICTPVMRTLLTHSTNRTAKEEERLASSWAKLIYSGSKPETIQTWLAAGVRGDVLDDDYCQRLGYTGAKQHALAWLKQNPQLDADALHSKDQIFAVTPAQAGTVDYEASPLLNPRNWEQMDKLGAACTQAGDPITKEDMLAPRIDGKSAVEIGVTVACRPQAVMHACAELGLQIGVKELLDSEGKPTPVLEGFIQTHSVASLFTDENWHGKKKGELAAVYNALPELSQQLVGNYHGLAANLGRAERAKQVAAR